MNRYFVFFFIILFVGVNVSGGFVKESKDISSVNLDGTILYVGGIGVNNYTSIQDAVDDASNGDIVFVYDDSSPYQEHVEIRKTITLIGEDRNTTRIEGEGIYEPAIYYLGVYSGSINGFTITSDLYGIWVDASNNIDISGNIITQTQEGVYLTGSDNIFISYNLIDNTEWDGISIHFDCSNINISKNIISNNYVGIHQYGKYQFWHPDKIFSNTQIINNEIIKNDRGVSVGTDGNLILNNNFIDNNEQASFRATIHNDWDGNYWSDSQDNPYVIWGRIGIIFNFIPWVNFDYNPASEPYDIN